MLHSTLFEYNLYEPTEAYFVLELFLVLVTSVLLVLQVYPQRNQTKQAQNHTFNSFNVPFSAVKQVLLLRLKVVCECGSLYRKDMSR